MNETVHLELPRPMFEYIVRVLAESPLRFADVAPVMDLLSKQAQQRPAPAPSVGPLAPLAEVLAHLHAPVSNGEDTS